MLGQDEKYIFGTRKTSQAKDGMCSMMFHVSAHFRAEEMPIYHHLSVWPCISLTDFQINVG